MIPWVLGSTTHTLMVPVRGSKQHSRTSARAPSADARCSGPHLLHRSPRAVEGPPWFVRDGCVVVLVLVVVDVVLVVGWPEVVGVVVATFFRDRLQRPGGSSVPYTVKCRPRSVASGRCSVRSRSQRKRRLGFEVGRLGHRTACAPAGDFVVGGGCAARWRDVVGGVAAATGARAGSHAAAVCRWRRDTRGVHKPRFGRGGAGRSADARRAASARLAGLSSSRSARRAATDL